MKRKLTCTNYSIILNTQKNIYTFVRACPDFTFMAVWYHPPENAAFPQCMFSLLKLNASSTEEVLNP